MTAVRVTWWQHGLVLLALLVVWHAVTTAMSNPMFPAPLPVWDAIVASARNGTLWAAVVDSNRSLFLGLLIAVPAGVLLGLLAGFSRVFDRVIAPYVDMSLVIPMVALVPVLIVVLGIGTSSRVAVVVLFALPDVLINARSGVKLADPRLLTMTQSFGARSRDVLRTVLLPTSFASIMTGIRIAIGRGITGMIVVELTLVASGMGGFLMDALGRFRPAGMVAMILVIGLEAIALTGLASAAERQVRRRLGT